MAVGRGSAGSSRAGSSRAEGGVVEGGVVEGGVVEGGGVGGGDGRTPEAPPPPHPVRYAAKLPATTNEAVVRNDPLRVFME